MFPDLDIARTFACGKDKTGYGMIFGLAPYFKQQLVESISKAGPFVLNQSTKKKQLNVHVHFWENNCVQSMYLGSQFLGHGIAVDLLHHIKECVAKAACLNQYGWSQCQPEVGRPPPEGACRAVRSSTGQVDTTAAEAASETRLSQSAFAKFHALWNKTSRSTMAFERECKLQFLQPNQTRWSSLFFAVERVVRIQKEQGETAIRNVCTALKIKM
ncbi:hypothetical protein JOB18_008031 [Solea senegalensis]|uniref:Uncharacterized protein n=1 Tax=Solea senegalensis TaxID=28829 RepID=A0AAV6SI70_SOLSE|nr:hypothetical protein JOB18_008031 [Solea senegalensis]